MAHYYGVTRSEEYIAHYGIKGMRWGVKKAKAARNDTALSKHFKKASAKLDKLNDRADIDIQKSKLKEHADKYKLASLGTLVTGAYTGGMLATNRLSFTGAGMTMAGLGRTAYHVGKMASAKYKTTKRGHAKAVAKRDKFASEMNDAFAGTKYGKKRRK